MEPTLDAALSTGAGDQGRHVPDHHSASPSSSSTSSGSGCSAVRSGQRRPPRGRDYTQAQTALKAGSLASYQQNIQNRRPRLPQRRACWAREVVHHHHDVAREELDQGASLHHDDEASSEEPPAPSSKNGAKALNRAPRRPPPGSTSEA